MKRSAKTSRRLARIYARLLARYGPQDWWPGETRLEVILGAILVQNTAWTNAERAVSALRDRDLLDPARLGEVSEERLGEIIRPSGYFRQKARKIRGFLSLLSDRFDGSLDGMAQVPTGDLRETLLEVWGIGPETADSILLYAFDRPVFVADAYTRRLLSRHGLLSEESSAVETRAFMEANLPSKTSLYNDFHAQIVRLGKDHCRVQARCDGCPLVADLPADKLRQRESAARGKSVRKRGT